jgi:hypothetical protein
VAELEADRLEIETIRMKEMDMVIALRDEVENTKKQHAQVAGRQCCGSGMFIPDPNFFHSGSRIRNKEFINFNPKIYDPGCSSRTCDSLY